jgi:hypothetical protein
MPQDPAGGASKVLTRDQIRAVASSAGFTGADLDIAVAVALAESGGDRMAHNSKSPDNSFGLWQINMEGDMGKDRRKRFGLTSNGDLYNPATNARVAKLIHKEQGWERGWTTYANGKYKKFMNGDGTTPQEAANGTSGASTDTSWSGKLQSGLNSIGENVFKAGANIGGLVAAIALGVLGVLILSRGVIGKAVPVGKIAKVAKKL